MPTGRRAAWLALAGALAIGLAAFGEPALAAVGGDSVVGRPGDSGLGADPLVERIQRALSEAGLYGGPATGRMDRATEAAIRAFQKKTGLTVDGRASEGLAERIETGRRVDALLGTLQRSRRENTEAARQALLGDPATRDLIGERPSEAADATRDFTPCLRAPTVACLLAEAAESAKAIAKDDLRDWALGELLAAQSRAGLADEARATAKRIADPRLIMVALRDIAEGQAAAGRTAAALEAAAIIPDADKRAEALIAVAAIQAHGDGAGALQTLERARATLGQVERPTRRLALTGRMAVTLAAAGNGAEARRTLAAAEDTARALAAGAERDAALRTVAAATAETGDADGALRILQDIGSGADVTPVLIAAAGAQADAGDEEHALRTADGIGASRYRAVVLGRIALAQIRAGHGEAALATLDKATAALDQITLPFARDFAAARIALTLAELAGRGQTALFERSVRQAAAIADDRLRAHALWTIAALRRRTGDRIGAETTLARAEAAANAMRSPLNRAWMFSDIALQHIHLAESEAAWRAFGLGFGWAAEIGNAWSRSRALSRMAVTLIELSEPELAWPDFGEQP